MWCLKAGARAAVDRPPGKAENRKGNPRPPRIPPRLKAAAYAYAWSGASIRMNDVTMRVERPP